MPTKRMRKGRHRLPSGFEAVGKLEQIQWAVYGPVIGEDPRTVSGVTVYATWEIWATFYGLCRETYLSEQRHSSEELACERLYAAIQVGRDPEEVLAELEREQESHDPRHILGK